MMSLSAAILVATCTATFGLHSSSSTTISYSYFAFASALRSLTARSAELRPPMPLTETPPVSGPMKPTFTASLASAAAAINAQARIVTAAVVSLRVPVIACPQLSRFDGAVGRIAGARVSPIAAHVCAACVRRQAARTTRTSRSPGLPIPRLLERLRHLDHRRLLEVPPDQHDADRQAVDLATGNGECRMAAHVERAGVLLHVEGGIDIHFAR